MVTVFTLGIAYPYALVLRQRWKAKHTYVNGRQLKFVGTGTGLFLTWLKWFFLPIITLGIYLFWVMPRLNKSIVERTDFAEAAPHQTHASHARCDPDGGNSMRRSIPVLAAALAVVLALVTPALGANGLDGDPATTERVDTSSPTTAAIAISNDRFPTEHSAGYAILSRDDVFADSLAASGLNNDGPLLFTNTNELTEATRQEFDRVLEDGQTVYLLGGPVAISQSVEDRVQSEGYQTERLDGDTRVETSVDIATKIRELNPSVNVATVARAFGTPDDETAGWVDSIAGGGWAANERAPILVTHKDQLDGPARDWLNADDPSTTYLLGGPHALSLQVEDEAPNSSRVAGDDRAGTAVEIAKQLWGVTASGDRQFVVTNGYAGNGWAFGLAGAGASQKYDAPVLVVHDTVVHDVTADMVSSCDTKRVDLLLMGDTSVISSEAQQKLDAQDGESCQNAVWDVDITGVHADPEGDDVQNENGEYVELTNIDSSDAQVGGWYILDAADNRLNIGDGYKIEPNTKLRVYTGPGTNTPDRYYNGMGSAVLNNDGDQLRLYTADGQLVDEFSY